jgi:hypothetical protein
MASAQALYIGIVRAKYSLLLCWEGKLVSVTIRGKE